MGKEREHGRRCVGRRLGRARGEEAGPRDGIGLCERVGEEQAFRLRKGNRGRMFSLFFKAISNLFSKQFKSFFQVLTKTTHFNELYAPS